MQVKCSVKLHFGMQIFQRNAFLKGLLQYYTIWIIVSNTTDANRLEGKLPDLSLMSRVFNMFVKPYLKIKKSEPIFRTLKETAVEKIVRQKVEQLAPFLQDNDFDIPEADNRFSFEGNDETTIIEFIPQRDNEPRAALRGGNDTFKANMQRYKKIRNKISKALEKELLTDDTKSLILQTFDELLSKMIETQCNWKGGENYDTQNNNDKIIIPRTIVKTWNSEWQKLKTKFSTLINQREDPLRSLDSLMSYLNSMNAIINDVSNNLERFSKKYRIRCNIYERKDDQFDHDSDAFPEVKINDDTYDNKNACNYIKICSKELKKYLLDFYNTLNDTAVNVLRNYGEMFTRDVYTDVSNEKENIVSRIFDIADVAEQEISEVFVNDTLELHLDDNKNKRVNINFLSEYIRSVTKDVKNKVGKIMEAQLREVPSKLYSSIQKDVIVNLGVDLGNLENDMISKICISFSDCNGAYNSRRFKGIGKDKGYENKMYIKVELTLDDELKDSIHNISSKDVKVTTRLISTRLLNYEKYANVIVTRTTII